MCLYDITVKKTPDAINLHGHITRLPVNVADLKGLFLVEFEHIFSPLYILLLHTVFYSDETELSVH